MKENENSVLRSKTHSVTTYGNEMEENGGVSPKENPQSTPWWKSTEVRFLILIGSAQVLLLAAMSILPSFFPLQAAKKGANSVEYGLIMGVNFLAMAIISVPWSYVSTKISCKLQMVFGALATALLTIIFGFVDRVPDGSAFLGVAFTLRILIGIVCCVFQVAAYSLVPAILVGRESTGFAILEMGVGLGYIVGPAIGGLLFDLDGFYLPFLGIGLILTVVTILCQLFIITPTIVPSEESISMTSFVFTPCAILYSLVIFSTELNFGYLAVTIETGLENYSLSHKVIGGIIVCSGISYALTTPLWGHVLDKGGSAEFGSLAGTLMACMTFLFYGPASWLPIDQQYLWLIIVSIVVCGLAVAAKMISAFKMLLHCALVICGLPDNLVTYTAVAAVFNFAVCLGGFAGPLIGGFLHQTIGRRRASSVIFFWELSLVTCQLLYIIFEKCKTSSRQKLYLTEMNIKFRSNEKNISTITKT